jgi:hypothetical protein
MWYSSLQGKKENGIMFVKERCSKRFDPTNTSLCMSWDFVVTRTFMKWQTVELKIIPFHTEIHSVVNNGAEVSDYANIKWMIQNVSFVPCIIKCHLNGIFLSA